jgi:AcrR family transcriptional regulator
VPKGRPREFDVELALERALQVFWRKGYEGTSLLDLTRALGISRPSLYAAFGNKESLFRKALARYAEGPASLCAVLAEPTARAVVERLWHGAAALQTDPRTPPGCLAVQGALVCGDTADAIRQELIARRAATQAALCERFERARAEGDLPADFDPADLARFAMTVVQGMAVQAAGGARLEELQRMIKIALRAWPQRSPEARG